MYLVQYMPTVGYWLMDKVFLLSYLIQHGLVQWMMLSVISVLPLIFLVIGFNKITHPVKACYLRFLAAKFYL
uniref:Uncharacterized protein n=1 Tax=Arundo donax TaxID=35708 RepID=A0A0A9FRG6_ARUDO